MTDEDHTGIKIIGEKPLFVSALNFSKEDLDSGDNKTQQHAGELTPRKEVLLTLIVINKVWEALIVRELFH